MTPRRILLLMGGLCAFGLVYSLYARLFGWLDGLPILPAKLLQPASGEFRPPHRSTSPTIELLRRAFGPNSPETEPAFYPTQLEFRNGTTSMVVAAGRPLINPGSNRVTLSPFSLATFGKPRQAHLLAPGETVEISSFHSDKAVLEFDRVINAPTDMNTAKLVRMELISDPELAVPADDKRAGKVHITNNQRAADPNRALVMKTVGPVFYRDPKYATGPALHGPDVWTDAALEIVDRGNLPRKSGAEAASAPTTGEESRTPAAVAGVLGGQRLPPPTVTAVGMRVYLEPDDTPQVGEKTLPKTPPKPKSNTAFGGVRRVELLEKVLMHLWVEGGQGTLVGSGGKSGALAEPPAATQAAAGGLLAAAHAAREFSRDLLQVETKGPFAYDAEKNLARFDVLPQADPNLPNDVRVTKVPPHPGTQSLFSQVLELEFNGSPTGNEPARPTAGAAGAGTPAGPKFKRLHAWTYTPGRILTVFSDADQLKADGQDLVHEQAAERTTLTGAPLIVEQNRNVLTAGAAKTAAVLILEPAPGVPAVAGTGKKSQATVLGAGRVELYDAASKANTTTASWQTSMVQTKERVNDRDIDLFTLTDSAKFEDVKADYWLKGKVLKLWLAPVEAADRKPAADAAAPGSRMLPQRVQAIGNVTGHSLEMDIDHADHLNSLFRDIPTPESVAPVAAAPMGPVGQPRPPGAPTGTATPQPAAAKEPDKAEKPKPPTKIRARTIDTWVVRSPAPKSAVPVPIVADAPAEGGLKYQLEKARCEDMVSVHQDPDDPTKPRGTDIFGSLLLIDSTPDGSVMTVFGWDNRPGEVHNEGTSLIGPKIVLDQLHNLAIVEGRGSVMMPASSDMTGAALKQAEVILVHFREGMTFRGAQKRAEFFGKVSAEQGTSWVTCHTMQVNFDRPVYFTQSNRPGAARKPANPNGPNGAADDKAKVEVIYCYPAPADTADLPEEKRVWYTQIDLDPATRKPIRSQRIDASELTLLAQVRDEGRGEPYRKVLAEGPGSVRTWAPGSRDDAGPGPAAAVPKTPAARPADVEMKLTVVTFSGRMVAKDKGKIYQDATFYDNVQVINVPTEDPDLKVERHKLPPRAVLLTCAKDLVVWTHRKGDEPAQQNMDASGNAFLQNEQHEGWGEVIRLRGKIVEFHGSDALPARIKSRFKGDDTSGQLIVFDRATNQYTGNQSGGGTISTAPGGPPRPKGQPKR